MTAKETLRRRCEQETMQDGNLTRALRGKTIKSVRLNCAEVRNATKIVIVFTDDTMLMADARSGSGSGADLHLLHSGQR
jgi:hypothetical protein